MEELRETNGRRRERNKSDSTLRVRLVQAMGKTDPIEKGEFYGFKREHGGSLWVPGTFGQVVQNENEMIGSWHWSGEYAGVNISILLFSNGRIKMSLGTGSWDPIPLLEMYQGGDPWVDTCGFLFEKICDRICLSWTIHLMSADKRYEYLPGIRTDQLADLWRRSGQFHRVLDPFTFETGRISTVKGYLEEKKLITIDHRGNVHFTGFKSWNALFRCVQLCDQLMHQYGIKCAQSKDGCS